MLKNRKKKGFTLIELIVVIAILGILAAVLIPKFTGFQDKARSTQALTDAKQIATAADSLIAEGKTTYDADGTSSSILFADADILKIAGSDIKAKVAPASGTATATITGGAITSEHFTFTYTVTINSKNFTCTRGSDGAFTTSWSE
jgi:type IV pilus assembly protein PilA